MRTKRPTQLKKSQRRVLKQLGVYDKWKANMIQHCKKQSMPNYQDLLMKSCKKDGDSLRTVISSGFVWSDANEGEVFWLKFIQDNRDILRHTY